eukprot:TRINITY_DN3058_c0_g2_i1.p1 TRINITY_DN3058_c0_g2~~TRINITY_DN3058_c0_g2_i1.p1  ORF type:complete len:211 (-),score=27.96 TRINITY_DN3058_c0_g2_i1:130-762(-)
MAEAIVSKTIGKLFQDDTMVRDRLLVYVMRSGISHVSIKEGLNVCKDDDSKRRFLLRLGGDSFVFLLDTFFEKNDSLKSSLLLLEGESRVMAKDILDSEGDRETKINRLKQLVKNASASGSSLTWSNSPFGFFSACLFGQTSNIPQLQTGSQLSTPSPPSSESHSYSQTDTTRLKNISPKERFVLDSGGSTAKLVSEPGGEVSHQQKKTQ